MSETVLRHMAPVVASDYLPYGVLLETVRGAEVVRRGAECVQRANVNDIVGRNLGASEAFQAESPLGGRVEHVVSARPHEQMIRPNTRTIVAMMADVHAGRDWPEVHLPGCPMRVNETPIAATNLPVSLDGSAGPFPAPVTLSDLGPEPIG